MLSQANYTLEESAAGKSFPKGKPRDATSHGLKILIVGSFLSGFALERYAGGNIAQRLAMDGVQIITTSRRRPQVLRLADMLMTAVSRRKQYNLAHVTVFSGRAFIYAECVAAMLSCLNKPCTLGLHGGLLPEFTSRHPWRTRRLFQRGKAIVCPSRYLYERLKPLKRGMRLIPNAIDIALYSKKSSGRSLEKLVWLRAFHKTYNPTMAPQVLAKTLKTAPQAKLTMIGPDKGDGSLEATKGVARELGVLDRITFAGPIPKSSVPRALSEHDILINTTNVDNTPVSVLEAMACGLPVVSTNVGGLPYLIEDGRTGLLVNPDDVSRMAGAVRRLLAEPDLAQNLSAAGRKLAESFDWGVILPQWEQLFAEVAAGRSPSAM